MRKASAGRLFVSQPKESLFRRYRRVAAVAPSLLREVGPTNVPLRTVHFDAASSRLTVRDHQ